jgi:hypothetical protein
MDEENATQPIYSLLNFSRLKSVKKAYPEQPTPNSHRNILRNNKYIEELPSFLKHQLGGKEQQMGIELKEWGVFEGVGRGFGFKQDERFYSLLETKVGAYRGNHVHPFDQYTLLIAGRGKYLFMDSTMREMRLRQGEVFRVKAGVPHILVPEEDCVTFEWWDGDFVAKDCVAVFDEYTRSRVGPDKLKAENI